VRFIPTEERFYSGGPTSVRGFRQNKLGPLVYVIDSTTFVDSVGQNLAAFPPVVDTLVSPTGGDGILLANAELRFPLSRSGRLAGVVFMDLGRVIGPGSRGEARQFRVTPGAGLRIYTPLGPLRLDVAYNGRGPERGLLFRRECQQTVELPSETAALSEARVCNDAIQVLTDAFFRPPAGNGLLGLGKFIPFFKNLRMNFSIGQAF